MDNSMIERFEQFTYSINGIYRYVLKIERDEMEKYGFRASYALYLAVMSRFPEGLTSARLSELCDRDKAGISRIVAEMEENGLITRKTNNENFYRAKLVLTDKGREISEFVQEKAISAVLQAGGDISDGDRKIFYDCLTHIATNLKKISLEGLQESVEKEKK